MKKLKKDLVVAVIAMKVVSWFVCGCVFGMGAYLFLWLAGAV